ncbi:hypothetical protein GW17_00004424 [Ensete ventricosum]|nr:hypothetical protein GW17_00004424 [Ensete ventricosum]
MGFIEVMMAVKAYVLMVLLQFGYAGMFVISVASIKGGMNHFVLVVYRNAIAALFVAPFALWFERFSLSLSLSLSLSPCYATHVNTASYLYEGNEPRAIVSLQSNTLETYSAELSLTTLICLTGAAMSAVVTLAVEGFRAKPWTIGWDMRLVTAIYSVRSEQILANTPFIYGR